MALATSYNVTVRQNIDWIFSITATSGGAAINLTGWNVMLEAKSIDSAVLTLAIGAGVAIPEPTTGIVNFRATGLQTAAISEGTYRFNVKATASGVGAIVSEWVVGTLTVLKAIA